MERLTFTLTTSAAGAASESKTPYESGFLHSIDYTPSAATITSAATLTVTGQITGKTMLTWAAAGGATIQQKSPRIPTHDVDGAASLFAAGGEPVEDAIAVFDEGITLTLAGGGASKTGTYHVQIE